MTLVEMTLRQFDEFAIRHEHKTFYQTSQYGSLMIKSGFKPVYLGLSNGNGIIAAALILIKKQFGGFKIAYSPRGYLIDFNNTQLVKEFTKEIKSYLAKKKVVVLKINPQITYMERDKKGRPINGVNNGINIHDALVDMGYEHTGFNTYFESTEPRWNMILRSEGTPIEVFNSFNKETRTKIRNSLRKGVETYKGSKEELKMFYQLLGKKSHKKFDYYVRIYQIFNRFNMFDIYFARINTEVFLRNSNILYEHELQKNSRLSENLQKPFKNNEDKTRALNKKLASDKLLNIYKADMDLARKLHQQNKYFVIACNAVIKYGNEVFFDIDGVNTRFKSFNANHLLKWKIIEEYRLQNYNKFNLNAITGDFTKKNKYLGLYTFKKGFGTNVTEYIGEYQLIINNARYKLYKTLKPIMKK